MKRLAILAAVATAPVLLLSVLPAFAGLNAWITVTVELWLLFVIGLCLALLGKHRFELRRRRYLPVGVLAVLCAVASSWIAFHRLTMTRFAYDGWHRSHFRTWYPLDPFRLLVALLVVSLFVLCFGVRDGDTGRWPRAVDD